MALTQLMELAELTGATDGWKLGIIPGGLGELPAINTSNYNSFTGI